MQRNPRIGCSSIAFGATPVWPCVEVEEGDTGEELFFCGGRRFRVLDIVLFDEEDESPFVGLLQVEGA
jgi:hypothetical protein